VWPQARTKTTKFLLEGGTAMKNTEQRGDDDRGVNRNEYVRDSWGKEGCLISRVGVSLVTPQMGRRTKEVKKRGEGALAM